MTLPPNRIEAAARAMDVAMLDSLATWFRARSHGYDGSISMNDADVADLIDRTKAVISELANGTAWLAPTNATGGMTRSGYCRLAELDGAGSDYTVNEIFAAMRDAFLQEPKEPE